MLADTWRPDTGKEFDEIEYVNDITSGSIEMTRWSDGNYSLSISREGVEHQLYLILEPIDVIELVESLWYVTTSRKRCEFGLSAGGKILITKSEDGIRIHGFGILFPGKGYIDQHQNSALSILLSEKETERLTETLWSMIDD